MPQNKADNVGYAGARRCYALKKFPYALKKFSHKAPFCDIQALNYFRTKLRGPGVEPGVSQNYILTPQKDAFWASFFIKI